MDGNPSPIADSVLGNRRPWRMGRANPTEPNSIKTFSCNKMKDNTAREANDNIRFTVITCSDFTPFGSGLGTRSVVCQGRIAR